MTGWLIALGIVVLLAILPLGVSVIYNTDGLRLRLILGPVRLTLLPAKKKEKKPKNARSPKAEKKGKPPVQKQPSEKGGSFTDFIPLVKVALNFLGDLRRKLRVNRLEMKLTMAGGDPCDLAVNYGKAWAALGNLMPYLERIFVIKKRDLEVQCDFTADQTLIFAHLDVTLTFGRLVSLAVRYGIRVLREFIKLQNKRKGGVNL